jgi:hypothetical protein
MNQRSLGNVDEGCEADAANVNECIKTPAFFQKMAAPTAVMGKAYIAPVRLVRWS